MSWTTGLRFSTEAGNFLIATVYTSGLKPIQPPIQWERWAVPVGIKWPKGESDYSSTSSSFINSFIHSSMTLQPFVEPWPILQFRNFFYKGDRTLRRVISPSQGHYLHTGQHKHIINAHTDIHALSEIQTHDPNVRANEDSSCLRPPVHCDRLPASSTQGKMHGAVSISP
jgi:hypothetical protein